MKLSFQKSIASSQATLPIVAIVVFALWFLLSPVQPSLSFSTPDYGLWKDVPSFLQEGYWALGIGAFCAALAVYLMAELNNANVLLRVNSRMLSSMLAILLCIAVLCHRFQPGSIVMLFSLTSFFSLFATYQQPNPLLTLFQWHRWYSPDYYGSFLFIGSFKATFVLFPFDAASLLSWQ